MPNRSGKMLRTARAGLSRLRTLGRAALLPARRPLSIFLGLLALTLLLDALNSFGLDDASDRAWGEAIDSVRGPLYGSIADARASQERIAVVLIDDRTFARNGQEGPPLDYRAQAEILAAVATAGPRAIFLDGHYPRSRLAQRRQSNFASLTKAEIVADPDLVLLAQTMQSVGTRTPLLIGPVSPNDQGLSPIRRILSPAAAPRSFGSGVHEVSIATNLDDPTAYPLMVSGEDRPSALPSAALALYGSYCSTRERPCERVPGYSTRPMAVQWGLGVSRWREMTLPAEERARCESSSSAAARLARFLWQGMTRALHQGEGKRDDRLAGERCGYHDILYAADLDERAPDGNLMRDHLRGKIVLIGFDLPSGGDRRVAPFYGDLPGVMTHAMAFDNLVTSGGRPSMKPATVFAGLNEQDVLQYAGALVAVSLVLLFSRNARLLFRSRDRVLHRRQASAGLIIAILALIGGSIMYYGWIRSWPLSTIVIGGLLPGGILGVALMVVARAGSRRGRHEGDATASRA